MVLVVIFHIPVLVVVIPSQGVAFLLPTGGGRHPRQGASSQVGVVVLLTGRGHRSSTSSPQAGMVVLLVLLVSSPHAFPQHPNFRAGAPKH